MDEQEHDEEDEDWTKRKRWKKSKVESATGGNIGGRGRVTDGNRGGRGRKAKRGGDERDSGGER